MNGGLSPSWRAKQVMIGRNQPGLRSSVEDTGTLDFLWEQSRHKLEWAPLFVLPPWLRSWWEAFGKPGSPYFYIVRNNGGELAGFAPLVIERDRSFFMGSEDVCDFMDFVLAPGNEEAFFNLFWEDLKEKGVSLLTLGAVRPDSTVARHVARSAERMGFHVTWEEAGTTLDMDLPGSWEEYLHMLSGKQRHELRRKLRRLGEAAEVNYRVIGDIEGTPEILDLFFLLFRKSRKDKEEFLGPERETFFRTLAARTSRAGLLRIGILELGGTPVAAVMCFDHDGVRYLYNSGFDPERGNLSVGLVSKILCIKDSIEKGMRKFDFLKGPEVYKYRLGGKEVPLKRCKIGLR
ncbi:MAG: GNAT family N-acetyltransferase [Deltaproteobacteria bacterium]|nr:GNAT family N-acetyltransferase [Deltaproteobacteria bacterium]